MKWNPPLWLGRAWGTLGVCLVVVSLSPSAFAHHHHRSCTPSCGDPSRGTPKTSVPEIDPGSALSALTLLSGGLMVVADRRRRLAK